MKLLLEKIIANTIGIGTAIGKIISNTIGIGIGVKILVLIISGSTGFGSSDRHLKIRLYQMHTQ